MTRSIIWIGLAISVLLGREIVDDRLAYLGVVLPVEHERAAHHPPREGEPLVESLWFPEDARCLQARRIVEALDAPCLASHYAPERWAGEHATLLGDDMAGL